MSNFWKDRPVFVTGATGFLGSRLIVRLEELRADVVGLLRDHDHVGKMLCWVGGDVCDQPLIERILGEYQIRTVFHLAAQSQVGVGNRNPVSTFDTNIRGTWSILEACRRSPLVQQVIVASSDKAYGEGVRTEDDPLRPLHVYDVSKAAADMIAQTYARSWGLSVAIARCANIFGGGDLNWPRLVPGTIRRVLRGERPVIHGDGRKVRDWLHVSDAVAGYVALAECLGDKPMWSVNELAFNFSLGIQETVLEVVRLITQLTGMDLTPVHVDDVPDEIHSQGLCCDKARRLLGWEPKVGLDEGLKEAVEWYRRYV